MRTTLTEKVNGRREWSSYGLNELQKVSSNANKYMNAIILTNALTECGLKNFGNRSFQIGSKMFLYITADGVVVVKGHHGQIEEIKDPTVIFERIRILWGNL